MSNYTPHTRTLAETVAQVRDHLSKVRTVNRNQRLNRYEGRNSSSTEETCQWHLRVAEQHLRHLPRSLQGLLWEEHRLAERLGANRDAGQDRPELKRRLKDLRLNLRVWLEGCGHCRELEVA